MPGLGLSGRRSTLSATLFLLTCSVYGIGVAQAAIVQVGSGACLESLAQTQQAAAAQPPKKKKGGFFGSGIGKAITVIGTGVAGSVLGDKICGRNCAAIGAGLGALGGNALANALDKGEQRRLAVASQQAVLYGRPQTISFSKGCGVIKPEGEILEEQRTLTIALAPGVEEPHALSAVGEYRITPAGVPLQPRPATGKALSTLASGTPIQLMGTVDAGKWALVGRDGVGVGYAPVTALRAYSGPLPEPGQPLATARTASVQGIVQCRSAASTMRNEQTGKQSAVTGRFCIGPDGLPQIDA